MDLKKAFGSKQTGQEPGAPGVFVGSTEPQDSMQCGGVVGPPDIRSVQTADFVNYWVDSHARGCSAEPVAFESGRPRRS
jgi:hypothetical protein